MVMIPQTKKKTDLQPCKQAEIDKILQSFIKALEVACYHYTSFSQNLHCSLIDSFSTELVQNLSIPILLQEIKVTKNLRSSLQIPD